MHIFWRKTACSPRRPIRNSISRWFTRWRCAPSRALNARSRGALWAEHVVRGEDKEFVSADFVQRLRIYPHALREENAYYSRNHMALLFGYFNAQGSDVGTTLPGARVFCAVSHDIITHETTHALLDGLHLRRRPTQRCWPSTRPLPTS
jgi:hypothetical protein